MEVRLKHETLSIEVPFTSTTPKGAATVIQFIQSNPIELESGGVLVFKETKIVANETESWLRIVVGPEA